MPTSYNLRDLNRDYEMLTVKAYLNHVDPKKQTPDEKALQTAYAPRPIQPSRLSNQWPFKLNNISQSYSL